MEQVGFLCSEASELETSGVAFNLEQSEKAFGLWNEQRTGDVMGRTKGYLQKYMASGP